MSLQFCFLYPEMVDKLILLESLGFLLAPEVRSHVSFPSLFKNTKKDVFFSFPHLFRESTGVTTSWQITQVPVLFLLAGTDLLPVAQTEIHP